jgi:hypothetical protein
VEVKEYIVSALRMVFRAWLGKNHPEAVDTEDEVRCWGAFYAGALAMEELLILMAQELKKRLDSDDLVH